MKVTLPCGTSAHTDKNKSRIWINKTDDYALCSDIINKLHKIAVHLKWQDWVLDMTKRGRIEFVKRENRARFKQ